VIDTITWCERRWFYFVVELLVCLWHPPPSGYGPGTRWYANSIAVAMVLRLYQAIRVMRDACPLYRARSWIVATSLDGATGNPEFNWVLTTRYFLLNYLWTAVLSMLAVSIMIFSYIAMVLQRTVDPEWTFSASAWATVTTMSTVGYGDSVVTTDGAKVTMSLAAFTGILLTSLTVFTIVDSLDYTLQEKLSYQRYKLHGVARRQKYVGGSVCMVFCFCFCFVFVFVFGLVWFSFDHFPSQIQCSFVCFFKKKKIQPPNLQTHGRILHSVVVAVAALPPSQVARCKCQGADAGVPCAAVSQPQTQGDPQAVPAAAIDGLCRAPQAEQDHAHERVSVHLCAPAAAAPSTAHDVWQVRWIVDFVCVCVFFCDF
jgi:hypothetical protein